MKMQMTTFDYLQKFLQHVGMPGDYKASMISCELCGAAEHLIIRDVISIGKGVHGQMPVVSCKSCGFLFQNPRFERQFYQDYYHKHYRQVVQGSVSPANEFIKDQYRRGELLLESLADYLPDKGELLDVGCSAGGLMRAFINKGWNALGTDPDEGYANYGSEKLKLPVECIDAEEMALVPEKYDLIIITGSLEHVYDPNTTLNLCRKASKKDGLLLLEGRGHPQSASKDYFNMNHHRYLTLKSIRLIMQKHGWEPIFATDKELCGPTRPGGIFCLGRATQIPSKEGFQELIRPGQGEKATDVLARFDELDRRMSTS
jgi:SAM-dependent methyltransferase